MNNLYEVNKKRWASMSLLDQMGNIASEVGRSFNARRRDNEEDCQKAAFRAIDLFDATVEALIGNNSAKVKEVLRAKESYLDAIFDVNMTDENARSLEKYFMQYAIAARITIGK
jgi:hypothetical protein